MSGGPSSIGLQRLVHQRVRERLFATPGEAVAWLGALQGQEYPSAKWSIGLRVSGATDASIEQAIAERSVMRTWLFRGTLFYVAPADIHWMLGLVARREIAGNAGRYRQLELDELTLVRGAGVIADALRDGLHLTRTELFTILDAAGISTAGQRGVYLLQRAALDGLVYQGEMRKNATTFIALPPGRQLPKEEALAELARRYFTSRGPATLADFAHWSGLPITEARAGLEAAKSALASEAYDGQTYWLASAVVPPSPHRVHMLSGFDEFILGYRDRSAVLAPEHADAICPGGNGVFHWTIVSDGRVIGTWRRTVKKNAVEISLAPFRPLRDDERAAIVDVAASYGAFLGVATRVANL